MTKPKREASKKHGDKMEPLIDKAAGRSSLDEESGDDDPTLLQDDDDEDVQNDDVGDRRDVGERDD
jgi:hypothetical protein